MSVPFDEMSVPGERMFGPELEMFGPDERMFGPELGMSGPDEEMFGPKGKRPVRRGSGSEPRSRIPTRRRGGREAVETLSDMPKNRLQNLSPEDLVTLSTAIYNGVGGADPNPYGVTPAARAALGQAVSLAADLNVATASARRALASTLEDRDGAARALAKVVAQTANAIYANPNVTAGMIAALDLSSRATTRTRITPKTPTDLGTNLLPTGAILLKWTRSGNPQGVVFRIEERAPTGDWTMVEETTATRIVLAGYPLGEPVAFRVVASKSGQIALPTTPVTFYGPDFAPPSAPALKLAA